MWLLKVSHHSREKKWLNLKGSLIIENFFSWVLNLKLLPACSHLWYSSLLAAASQVSDFMSAAINPVVPVNVIWRLASESAQCLFGNPTLAYYGAISWVLWFFDILLCLFLLNNTCSLAVRNTPSTTTTGNFWMCHRFLEIRFLTTSDWLLD